MDKLTPFRVHYQDEDMPPFDTEALDARAARKAGELARPGHPVRKVKVIREKSDG